MRLGDIFPNFQANSTEGPITFYDWMGDSWCILFSHPADFTPVCTTELSRLAKLAPEFHKRGVKVLALSCDAVETHQEWIKDIEHFGGLNYCGDAGFPYPILADESRELATLLNMLDPVEKDKEGLPLTARAVFVVSPNHRMRLSLLYPATTGRNFSEILRAVDSLLITDKYQKIATPADWQVGDKVMVQPSVLDSELQKYITEVGSIKVPSGRDYMRCIKLPTP